MEQTVIAYIPALHKGYIDFFKKYPGTLYLLDSDLVLEVPRLERDIRAIGAEEMQKLISSLNIFKIVKVLSKKNLEIEKKKFKNIVMPDEDVSHVFAEKYLSGLNTNYVTTFLRWDKHSALKDTIKPNPDRLVSEVEFDKEMIKKASLEAEKSSDWWRQIGVLVVKDGKVIFTGHNKPLPSEGVHNIFGDPRSNFDYGVSFELSKFLHAEAGVIAEAAKRGVSLDGAIMYVTTFPCPVCAKSIAVSGVKKVFYREGYSLLDAEDILKSYGVEIIQVNV
jgi:dCMP deaminase